MRHWLPYLLVALLAHLLVLSLTLLIVGLAMQPRPPAAQTLAPACADARPYRYASLTPNAGRQ